MRLPREVRAVVTDSSGAVGRVLRLAVLVTLLLAPVPASAQVTGFVPHWDRDPADLPWSLLDSVVYFGASANADGTLAGTGGWPDDDDVVALRDRAADEGVAVLLTVTNFDPVAIGELVGDEAARAQLIGELVPLVLDHGAVGVNIDFEFVAAADGAAFLLFLDELRSAFHAADPDSLVTVAAPAVDWSGSYQASELLDVADAVFIMAYNYHYRGGNPGPVAPLAAGEIWNENLTLLASADYYLADVQESQRKRVILGLPLYGYDWPSESGEAGAAAIDLGEAIFYADFQDDAGADLLWDDASATPWLVYTDEGGDWHQAWCENADSIATKVAFAAGEGMGVGFWALGYDDGDDALWTAVEEALTLGGPPDAGTGGPDAGVGTADPDASAMEPGARGGCRTSDAGSAPALALLLTLVVLLRLRRRA